MRNINRSQWTDEADKILVDSLLAFIKEGDAIADAYQKTGMLLNRSAASVGQRWNKKLRILNLDKYKQAIAEAKEKKALDIRRKYIFLAEERTEDAVYTQIDIDDVMNFIRQLHKHYFELIQENKRLEKLVHKLLVENEALKKEHS